MWIITLETEKFLFEAFGASEEEANEAMGRALDKHRDQFCLTDDWWADYEFNSRTVCFGKAYRDGQPL